MSRVREAGDEYRPSDKAKAASAAAGVAAAIVMICGWLVGQYWHVTVPDEVRGALVTLIGALITAGLTLWAAYATPETNPSASAMATLYQEDPDRRQR